MAEAILNDIAPEVALPPTQDELPCDDGAPLEIYRNPEQGNYQHIERLRSGQVTPLRLPEVVIQFADLFPGN